MNTTPSSSHPEIDAMRREPAAGERALVLGGGGSTGNAWLIGVVAGLFDAGLDVTEADLIIGTSAGSTAAAQITSATPTDLFAAILAAAPQQQNAPIEPAGGRVPRGVGGRPSEEDEPGHRRSGRCGRHAPQEGCGGARTGCGVGRRPVSADGAHCRRAAAESRPKPRSGRTRCPSVGGRHLPHRPMRMPGEPGQPPQDRSPGRPQ
jgi:hypothetical protein